MRLRPRRLASNMARCGGRPSSRMNQLHAGIVEDCAWWLLGRCVGSEHTAPRGAPRQQRAVAEAEAFIAEHYREPLTLAAIAAAVHMSPFHLSRLFRRLTGTRLYWRVTELRLRESLQDVIDSSRSLTEIAADFGFSSPSHFCHAFRVTFGSPPSHFRGRQATRGILERRISTNR